LGFVSNAIRAISKPISNAISVIDGSRTAKHRMWRAQDDYSLSVNSYNQIQSNYQSHQNQLENILKQMRTLEDEKSAQESLFQKSAEPLGEKRIALETQAKSLNQQRDLLEVKVKDFTDQTANTDFDAPLQKMLHDFKNKFETQNTELTKKKQFLSTIDEEEDPLGFRHHKTQVKQLIKDHASATTQINQQHQDLRVKHQTLEKALQGLTLESQTLIGKKAELDKSEAAYKDEVKTQISPIETKLKSIIDTYRTHQQTAKGLETTLKGYEGQLDAQSKVVEGYAQTATQKAATYQSKAQTNAMLTGVGMGLLTYGYGHALGLGGTLSKIAGVVSGFSAMNSATSQAMNQIKGMEGRGIDEYSLNQSNVDLQKVFENKVAMPEFGGIKQSLEHFKMPTLPKLGQLPKLDEALGQVSGYKQRLESLGILDDAKQPIHRSFLNPEKLQLLKGLLQPKNVNVNKMNIRKNYG